MTLIIAEKLKKSYEWWEGSDRQLTRDEAKHYFDAMIDVQATIEAEPIKHGRWIDGKCSQCGGGAPFWAMASTYYRSYYCPHCGAKMDEEEE